MRSTLTVALTTLVPALLGCGPVVHEPGNGLNFGQDGTFAVREEHTWMVERGSSRPITWMVPLRDAANADSMPDGLTGVVLVQGGLVQRDRYAWLGRHLASRGHAVIIPEHAGWLALLDGSVALAAKHHMQEELGSRLARVVMGGHSLGGVAAARAAISDDEVAGLFLLASEAAADDDVENWRLPMVSIAGTADQSQSVEKSRAGWERFGGRSYFAVVDALTHFAWTTPGRDPTVLRENEPQPGDVDSVRKPALVVLDAFIEQVVTGVTPAVLDDDAALPAGVAVERSVR